MRLTEFTFGQYYADILLMMSKYISKKITGSEIALLVMTEDSIKHPVLLTPKSFIFFNTNVSYGMSKAIVQGCVFEFTIIDKDTMSKKVIKIGQNFYKNDLILTELDHTNFYITHVTKYIFVPEYVDFREEHTKPSNPHNSKLIHDMFHEMYNFLVSQGEPQVNSLTMSTNVSQGSLQ